MDEEEIIENLNRFPPYKWEEIIRKNLGTDNAERIIRLLTKAYFYKGSHWQTRHFITQFVFRLGGKLAVLRLKTLKAIGG